jgi:hypothetical protein
VAHPQIAVFARLAKGNDQRIRAIEGQLTNLGRTMHAIAYDPIHDEIVVPQQFGQGILTFAGDANGEVKPKRFIEGPHTGLVALDRLGVDPVHNEYVVPEGRQILVFPREGNGDVAPIRTIEGPDTRIGSANSVAIDPVRNLLVVASTPPRPPRKGKVPGGMPAMPGMSGEGGGGEGGEGGRRGELTIFDRTANGNVKPLRYITNTPGNGNIQVNPELGLIFLVGQDQVAVYSIEDSGNVPPRFTIGGPKGILHSGRGVTIDAKNKSIIVSDKYLNSALTFYVPEVFQAPTTAENHQDK